MTGGRKSVTIMIARRSANSASMNTNAVRNPKHKRTQKGQRRRLLKHYLIMEESPWQTIRVATAIATATAAVAALVAAAAAALAAAAAATMCVCVSGLRLRLGYCKCMRYQSLVPSR